MREQKQIMEYAVRLLAGRRYHSAGLRNKLLRRTDDLSLIEKVITRLKDLNYLDDDEYIRLYISDSIRLRPRGRRMIRRNLMQKNIPAEEVDKHLNQAEIDEFEMASASAKKKLKTIKNHSPQKIKEKLYRFLISRGFASDAISHAVKTYIEPLQKR